MPVKESFHIKNKSKEIACWTKHYEDRGLSYSKIQKLVHRKIRSK